MYNFSSPNFCLLALNINRVYEIAKSGNHSVKLVPSENCCLQDIDLLNAYYGFTQHANPDMIIEVCYSPTDVLNVFKDGKYAETLEQINERLPKTQIEIQETLGNASLSLLKVAIERLKLGVNDVLKIHSLSKTIAMLSESEIIKVEHVAEAVQYRSFKP